MFSFKRDCACRTKSSRAAAISFLECNFWRVKDKRVKKDGWMDYLQK